MQELIKKDWQIELRQLLNSYSCGLGFSKIKAKKAGKLFLDQQVKNYGNTEELSYKLELLKQL